MIVRPLTAADAIAFRIVRLEALRLHPESFGSTLADWEVLPESAYVARIEDGVIFGLFTEAGLEGIMAYDREKGGNARHRAGVHAVYVRESLRGTGAADLLMQALIDRAKADCLRQIELSVSESGQRAYQFYLRHGFVRIGETPRALLVNGRFLDEYHLRLTLAD